MTTTTIATAGKVARSTNVARSTPAVDAAATRSPRAGEAGAISPASAPPPTESRSRDDHHMYLSFDRAFKANLARLTFGLSPALLAEQTFDWLAHLVISPGKQLQLIEKAFRDAARFGIYAAQSLADPGTPPCISALPQDRRVSCHSFIRMARLAEPLMRNGGALFTMSYYGAEKVIEHYNVMGPVKAALESAVRYLAYEFGPKGIRVHAISPGPVKTRAASGIDHFDDLLELAAKRAPARQLVSIEDVGVATAVLATDYAKLITGERSISMADTTSSGSPKSLICIKAQSAFADSFSAAHSRPTFAHLAPS
jgi:NAD(P)-dependent dehydrogenase (short-subunit alcohol dehydrogenase family)